MSDVSHSFAAIIGHVLVPVLRPAGLGQWQVAVALISGLSAKEVVVSSFSVLYGISNVNSAAGMTALSSARHGWFWRCERLCPDDILSPVFTLYRGSGNH